MKKAKSRDQTIVRYLPTNFSLKSCLPQTEEPHDIRRSKVLELNVKKHFLKLLSKRFAPAAKNAERSISIQT